MIGAAIKKDVWLLLRDRGALISLFLLPIVFMLAFGMMFPRRKVLIYGVIPMPAWAMVAGYGAIELAQGVIGTQQGVAHFAHLGGMLGAFIVLFTMARDSLRRARQIY
jgi:membrane associated rhomboid family serine protease